MSALLETRNRLLRPTRHLSHSDQVVQERIAFLVGVCAFALPVILLLGSALPAICFRDSLSHFYFDPYLGPVFVGFLFFIGGFLIALTGETRLESLGTSAAGLGSMAVATFPTEGAGCELFAQVGSRVFASFDDGASIAPMTQGGYFNIYGFELWGKAIDLHAVGAGTVFVFLGLYCLFVLTRVDPDRHATPDGLLPSKRRRNLVYVGCGVIILFCVALLAFKFRLFDKGSWNSANLTFWFESQALWAFGLAWFTKGRRFSSLNDTRPAWQIERDAAAP